MKKRSKASKYFEESSGNVFADVGLEDADELLVRADLMIAINREIEARGLTQAQASDLIGLTQSDISNIARSKYSRFSQERLMDALRRLGLDVEINIQRSKTGHGTVRVRRFAESEKV
jgi:predicted XRE-type DNA-binding protein